MRVISENIANSDSVAQTPGGDPYRRRVPTFRAELDRALDARVVSLGPVRNDPSDFQIKFQPGIRRRMPPATSNFPTSIR